MAALTPVHYRSGNAVTTQNVTGGNTGDTIALAGSGPGKCQRITDVWGYAAGTITAIIITVTKADGTTLIAKWGGTGAAATPVMTDFHFTNPIICAENDNALVSVIMTGATAGTMQIGVNYTIGNL